MGDRAQDVLFETKQNRYHIIVDVFGAFHYAGNQIEVILSVFHALVLHGKAFLVAFSKDTSTVGEETLVDHLCKVYPHLFRSRNQLFCIQKNQEDSPIILEK